MSVTKDRQEYKNLGLEVLDEVQRKSLYDR